MPRTSTLILATLLTVSVCLSFLWLLFAPDPAAGLFAKAQQLEAAGQTSMALRHYQLLVASQPTSFYAPRSLMRSADLLAARAQRTNDMAGFREAMAAYKTLQIEFPSDTLAKEAMLNAGQIATENLKDYKVAREIYQLLLSKAGDNPDTAALATLKLGRLALLEGDAKGAISQLQTVITTWPRLPDRAAEAQYHLGLVYELLTKQKDWASRAYEAVIARYPASSWATDAREKLGFLVFLDTRGQRSARRVMLDISPVPDDGVAGGALWNTLRPLLAARGLDADQTLLRGWSLIPFYAGVDTANPGKTVQVRFDPFENVLSNVGLRFTVKSGGDPKAALRDLQDDLDNAGQPMVHLSNGSAKGWALVIGYDSDRAEVMIQRRGARYDTLAARVFVQQWKPNSPLGNSYTLLKFSVPGQKPVPAPSLTPTPSPTVAPGETAMTLLQVSPSFTWRLPQLQTRTAHLKTLDRAAAMLQGARQDSVLLGTEGLAYLAEALDRSGRPAPLPTALPPASNAADEPEPTPEPTPESPYDPSLPPNPGSLRKPELTRIQPLMAFFGAPAREYAARRREAAAYLERTGSAWDKSKARAAAEALRQTATALDEATLHTPTDAEWEAGDADSLVRNLARMAQAVRRAREQERQAIALLRDR